MKFYKLLMLCVLFIGMATLNSCKKDDDNPSSSSTTTPSYNLRFTCTSTNPYLVEINGTSNVLQGGYYRDYTLKQGTYAWKVTQQSGYLLYPTIKSGTYNLTQDGEIIFP